jgi:hypothetical protein
MIDLYKCCILNYTFNVQYRHEESAANCQPYYASESPACNSPEARTLKTYIMVLAFARIRDKVSSNLLGTLGQFGTWLAAPEILTMMWRLQ